MSVGFVRTLEIMSLQQYNLLKAQFGFRKYHSRMTCILKLLDYTYRQMETGHLTGVVFLDLKKAFDMVHHQIMINIFNLSNEAIAWFENYFSNRFQAVIVIIPPHSYPPHVVSHKGQFLAQ